MQDRLVEETKALRLEVTALQETADELRAVIKSERAKIIEMPSRRAN
jgi:hypothetical protein